MLEPNRVEFVPLKPHHGENERKPNLLERWRLFDEEVDDFVLSDRAWVLHKRLLSPRSFQGGGGGKRPPSSPVARETVLTLQTRQLVDE